MPFLFRFLLIKKNNNTTTIKSATPPSDAATIVPIRPDELDDAKEDGILIESGGQSLHQYQLYLSTSHTPDGQTTVFQDSPI